jgi:putative membrane protein
MRSHLRSLFLLLAALASLAGCADGVNLAQPEQPAVVAGKPLTAAEREFATKVVTRTVFEIEVSRLAAERAMNPSVRDYAKEIASQHSRMNDELVRLMSAHGVAPPRGLSADKATKLHRLAAVPRGQAFDSGYIRVVGIEDHRRAIQLFEKARGVVRDRDLRAWIDRWLAQMRSQLVTAQSVASSLAG